MYIVMI